MNRKGLLWCLVLTLTIICVPLTAWSGGAPLGTIDLPATGQTTSYAPGDDGDLQMGAVWPGPRFQDNADGTITDLLTGLMWAASSTGPATFYNGMTATNASTLGGYGDWRMPNIREMESLTNAGEANSAVWLNGLGFTVNTGVDSMYWVSNGYAAQTAEGWAMFLTDGTLKIHNDQNPYFSWPWNFATYQPAGWPLMSFYYLPVRAGANSANDPTYPANISKTGRRTDIPGVNGDDGQLKWGVDWPVSCFWDDVCVNDGRFTNNGDGTMTDNLTGLMWLQDVNCMLTNYPGFDPDIIYKCTSPWWKVCTSDADCDPGATCTVLQPPDGAVEWQLALDFVAGINDGTYPLCNAGYSDWRFANRKEIWSLITMGLATPVPGNPETSTMLYLEDQGFNMTSSPNFWTSTVDPADTSKAYSIAFSIRSPTLSSPTRTTGRNKVWPVRTAAGDDGDGVSIYVEDDAPNNGDGNDDGTQDFLQPLVTSLPGAGGNYVTVVTSPAGGCTQNMNVQTAVASPADPGFSYSLGAVGFEIRCATGPADMEIIFHGSSDLSGMVYRNYGSTGPGFGAPAWYEMTGATFGTRVIDGQTVATATFQIVENQLGDHDPAGNLILSLGGPALPAPPMAIPTMTQWGMIVFMLLAVTGAVYYLRRRRYNN